MDGEIHYLPLVAVPELLALRLTARDGYHHIAEKHRAGVHISLAFLSVKFAGRQFVHREAQNVSRAVNATELVIHAVYPLVVRQHHAHDARHVNALGVKRHVHRFFYQRRRIIMAEVLHLAAYIYLMLHAYFLLNFFGGSFLTDSAGFFLS